MTAPSTAPFPAPFRGRFLLDENDRAAYAGASGILRAVPRAVAVPADRDDLVELVAWASRTGTPLVPRSAATGMPGGNVGAGVAVDLLSPFQRVHAPDPGTRRIEVEVGATLASVNEACRPLELHFPVDPSSGTRCTFGGMLANNSAGPHSVRYGAVRPWVDTVEVVLADGTLTRCERGSPPESAALRRIAAEIDEVVLPRRQRLLDRWPRVRKNSSGYALREYLESGDLLDLLVGSEGTLCLMVSAVVRLAPLPPHRGLALLEFTDLEAAGAAVQSLLAARPATCEMLDRTFLELVRAGGGETSYPIRAGLEAILLVEMEGDTAEEVREGLGRVAAIAGEIGATHALAMTAEEQSAMWGLRRAASPIIAQQAGTRVSMQFIEDCVVPVEQLATYVRELRAILERHGLPAVIFGHAGDGNLHVNPLVDVHAPGWVATLEAVLAEVAALVARLGGTLAGEHGDGRLRAPFLETIWGAETVALFRAVKTAFDPQGILNPGVILPLAGQRPFEGIRSYA
ncbi:MAG TPA: FAD-binding oxidoreductase [Longimicrobiaceae bacterium]